MINHANWKTERKLMMKGYSLLLHVFEVVKLKQTPHVILQFYTYSAE